MRIVRHRDGSYNFMDLVDEYSKKQSIEIKFLNYSLNNIRVIDGRIDFDDGPRKTRHEVRGIHLAVPFVSNLPYYVDRYIQPSFEAVINGNPVSLNGKSKPFSESRETTFGVNIKNLNIPYYLAYLPDQREFEIPTGFLDVKAIVSFVQPKGKLPSIRVEGNVTLREVRLQGREKSPMLHLPRIEVVVSPSDIVAREFRVASLTIVDPGIDTVIDRSGKLNLLLLSMRGGKGNDKDERPGTSSGGAEPASPETKIFIEAIRLSGGKVRFRDRTTDPPVELALDRIRLMADNVTTEKDRKAKFSFSTDVHRSGGVSLDGNFSVDPPSLGAKVRVKAIPISPVQPYFTDRVKIIVNLLVKAATSPFALLGAIFGGGEELSYHEFDPGTTALPGTAEAGKIGNLAQAYREEKFPKPRNVLGMARDLPVAEMEKLMLTHIPVTNDDLRQIALQRASTVKERLIGTGKIEPGRIFLVEPKTLSPERKEKLRDSRVDFRIR